MAESGGRIIRAEETNYKLSDPGFYMDARLTAIVNGTAYDFMGKSIFSVGFMRQGVGFGIINIDVEVNTSLQPVITITFKDLYGNALFGRSVGSTLTSQISESFESSAAGIGGDTPSDNLDFSVLFNWPPPKFLFTFKGFLGKQVSWLLNLKKANTTYQSDGSYEIKCEFVPNQWGPMADLPFLFLLAVKGLKKNQLGSESEKFKNPVSIFDLIKIGKQVEIKTKETSKEFDVILKQMTLIKSGRIAEAISINKIIKFNETIDGTVGNLKITGNGRLTFNPVTIPSPPTVIGSPEAIKQYTSSNVENLRRVNTYLLLSATIGGIRPYGGVADIARITFEAGGVRVDGNPVEDEVRRRTALITDNITLIEEAIKQKTYDSSKNQLRQITIGEIFGQLAKDSGYILGRILQAGYKAYKSNKTARDGAKITGKQYPLIFDQTPEKKEMPAIGMKLGVEEGELAFVDEFISAISEGIAKDLIRDDQAGGISDESRLIKRINNVECTRGNPYAPFYRNIAENIVVRSGIIAFLTRSNDPNYPGDYGKSWYNTFDRDSVEEVQELAAADMENITTSMLSSMDDMDFLKLKRFCIYWTRLLSADGANLLKNTTDDFIAKADVGEEDEEVSPFNEEGSLTSIRTRRIVIEADAEGKPILDMTLNQIILEVFNPRASASDEGYDSSNMSFIDPSSLQAIRIFNNGIIYQIPTLTKQGDVKTFVAFQGQDATKAKEANNSSSDASAKAEDQDEDQAGIVAVDAFNGSDGDILGRVEFLNEQFQYGVLKYENMVNPAPELFKNANDEFDKRCVYPPTPDVSILTQLVDPNSEISAPETQLPATNMAYAVAFHWNTADQGLVFGPFSLAESSQNHRACIRQMCQTLLEKMNKLEEERNAIISEVLGKGNEQREAMYKQFHVLYHQWESLMFEDPGFDDVREISLVEPDPDRITETLEKKYSDHHSTNGAALDDIPKNSFVYDYPLNKQAGINVKESIINLDPLYNPNGSTTVLNIIQQICTKNNFIFIPIPGNGDFNNYLDIFSPHISTSVSLKNFFYVMFAATPESRATISNEDKTPSSLSFGLADNIPQDAYEVKVGSPDNKIFKGLSIDAGDNKTTAESIVNLQRLVDKENQNKTVTTDCSMLPVMEGRSYKASFDMIGNAQIFPMQYFYLNSIPLFNGIYQVLKVRHSIKPNDMTTTAEGIRMRFDSNTGDFGGIPPITLKTLEDLDVFNQVEGDASVLIKQYTQLNSTVEEGESEGNQVSAPGSDNPVTGGIKPGEAYVKKGIASGSYLRFDDLSPIGKSQVSQMGKLVVIREYANKTRTAGTMWYNGRVIGFTVEDAVRSVKVMKSNGDSANITAIPAGEYNVRLDKTGNKGLIGNYVKFPEDNKANPYREPGVFARVGTSKDASVLVGEGNLDFGGIRIHNGGSEAASAGCIIYSDKRKEGGTLVNNLEHNHELTKLIYKDNINKIIVSNEFERIKVE